MHGGGGFLLSPRDPFRTVVAKSDAQETRFYLRRTSDSGPSLPPGTSILRIKG